MTIQAELYELSSRDPDGSRWSGSFREVITGQENGTTALQLLPEQSGALVVSAALTGAVYTLPTPVVGMWFEFYSNLAPTTNEYKVITKAGTELMIGALVGTHATVGSSGTGFTAEAGDSFISISQNGTTSGGIPGDNFILTAISTTRWLVTGWTVQSGSVGTPFDTT